MKKLLLVWVMFVLLTSVSAQTTFSSGGIYYNTTSGSTVEVVSLGGRNKYNGDITIPATVVYLDVTYTVTSIGFQAFVGCSSLTSITIPSSVTSINNQAFDGCTELSEIHCQKDVPLPITSRTFKSVGKATCKLYVPKGSSVSYSKAPYWKEFQTIIEEDSKAL